MPRVPWWPPRPPAAALIAGGLAGLLTSTMLLPTLLWCLVMAGAGALAYIAAGKLAKPHR